MKIVQSKFERLLNAFRKRGLRSLFDALAGIFFGYMEFAVFAASLSKAKSHMEYGAGLEVRQIKDVSELQLIATIASALDIARFNILLKQASIGFYALQDGKLAGYAWISIKSIDNVNRIRPPLQPGDALLHDLFVSAEFRHREIAKALILTRQNYLRDAGGYLRALSAVDLDNEASLKLHEKMGYQRVADMTYRRILFWHSTTLKRNVQSAE